MVKRVLIVGAGPGGLACAMLLARAGLSVRVLERLPHVGGRTSRLRIGGFSFDLGPTFFLYPRVLEKIFRAVGRTLTDEVDLIRLDPQYRLVFGAGGELLATPDLDRMEKEIAGLAPGDDVHLRSFLNDNRLKLAAFRKVLESPFHSWRDLCRWDLLRLLPLLRPWRSLDGELKAYFRDPRIRLAFSFQSKYLGMSPYQCPSLFSILSFLEYEYGVHHPVGGCGAVSEAMADVATDLGVEIHLDEPVEEILFEGRRAVGVRTSKGVHRADAVVLNADFARAMTHLIPDRLRRRWTDRRLSRKRFSCSTFMMYLGLDGAAADLPHHTIYISKDYERNLREIEQQHTLSTDPSYYVQNPGNTDPTLAPPGMSTLYVLVPVTHMHPNVDWARERDRFRALVLRQLAHAGWKDIERRIVLEKTITPAEWDRKYAIHLGATFNLAHTLRQMLHLRPRNRFEDVGGVYLVGGGTHPGSGLPVIYESACITAKLLLEDFQLAHDWIEEPCPVAAAPNFAKLM